MGSDEPIGLRSVLYWSIILTDAVAPQPLLQDKLNSIKSQLLSGWGNDKNSVIILEVNLSGFPFSRERHYLKTKSH